MNNELAFPGFEFTTGHGNQRKVSHPDGSYEWEQWSSGMTLRDYFAAKAMQAIITSPRTMKLEGKAVTGNVDVARAAYNQADSMLKEREK